MPTRIVLKQPARQRRTTRLEDSGEIHRTATNETRARSVVGFRSSILRDWNGNQVEDSLRLSSDDIRASPRLLGYLFSMIASAVMLVSVLQFYRREEDFDDAYHAQDNADPEREYFVTSTGVVLRWKLWGAVYMSSFGAGINLFILLVHFDTMCFPHTWLSFFRDGSLAERNLQLFLILFWAAGVHVLTSSLSVGESQANTFFTCWIAFGSTVLNYGVWRESSGLPSASDYLEKCNRETTYNWIWTMIFSTIFAGAATDLYYNRDEITLRFQNKPFILEANDWRIVLAVVWTEVAVCMIAIVVNEGFSSPFSFQRVFGTYRCSFGWRQLEGLIFVTAIGAKFWVILEYAGVDGVINGLSNAYFGMWGTFFNSVFTFGTWLRENKDIEYFVNESSSRRFTPEDEASTRPQDDDTPVDVASTNETEAEP